MLLLCLQESLVLLIILCLVYVIALVVHRLFFSPLAKFPGPKLAAATLWYEYYYDVVKRGRYTWKIAELHDRYGPIIRISPYELHIDDPEYYDDLYVGPSTRRTLKYEWAVRGFGPTLFTFSTISHELHRTRRGAVAPFFSKALVQQFEPSVQAMIQKLLSRLDELKGTGAIVNMINMYPCLTSDIICQYAFGAPYGYLDMPEFAPLWHKAVMDASEGFHFFKQFPWLETTLRKIPQPIIRKMVPNLASLFLLTDMIREKVDQVLVNLEDNKKPDGQRTIFHDLFTDDHLIPEEKTPERLAAEAHTLSVISYHIIANPGILHKLQDELATVLPSDGSKPKWSRLEQLPYLVGICELPRVIWFSPILSDKLTECYHPRRLEVDPVFKVSCGVSHRLQRISPDTDLTYQEWSIPKGVSPLASLPHPSRPYPSPAPFMLTYFQTPVGMTSVLMHNNTDLFPNPHTFDPERWLQPDSARLRKYIVPFSKGSRQCLGTNLAYCELYLTLATLFAPGRFTFELYETDMSDVKVAHDFFNASQSVDSKGIRVKVQ
ncbi:MAG: hypothetical protein L6R40_001241 [Gallowayella cf. fulva]|nr:MAG: hypothetical protein L6R40_001241 [Xanthomendoza cf. fulva]